ncbi:jg20702 [Pararge aegeria aegeria]|uniref:Jg20702 protein n=1 Tax=Pararge aegeria aegeria TaxID=348720 RepID=A0A8S4QZV3_9NEOP|nr:jg20702 [Pararge aegeria aegeria]
MVNRFLETGIVPDPWKSQIIIPIRKPCKDPLDCNSYRPIALSSTLAKIMEHLIKNRLEWIIESRGLLAKTQFGFRKGLGTIDSLAIISTDIRIALARREYLVAVFLDVAAAYDNVLLPYADDIAIYSSSNSMDEISVSLNTALYYLGQWLSNHGLSLSTAKCKTVIFTRKRQIAQPIIVYEDQQIPLACKFKFLGVFLDSRLNGIAHIDYILKKCEKNINILRALSGVWWGSHPFSQKLLYNAIVRSHLDYGLFVLDPINKLAFNKLNKIQFKCLRLILGAMKSSPTNVLQVECVDPPILIRSQYLCDCFISKVLQLSSHPLLDRLNELSEVLGSNQEPTCLLKSFFKFTRLPHPIKSYPKLPLFSTSFAGLTFTPVITNLGLDKQTVGANTKFNQIINQNWSDYLTVFTDASKLSNDGCVGAACWIPKYSISLKFKCTPKSSVFTGEAIAILEAILFVESHNIKQSIILTDSLSCIQALQANPFRSKALISIIFQIREVLCSCQQKGLSVTLAWIPGHMGIKGNETVDVCAKLAIEMGSLVHFKNFPQDLRSLAKTHLRDSWNVVWTESKTTKGKFYSSVQPDIPRKPWFFMFRNMNRWVSSTISRLRIGHACTPVHLSKLRIRDHSMCECGLDEGSVAHILFSCPKLLHKLYDVLPPSIPRPLNVQSFLMLVFSRYVEFVCKFIQCNKIKF